MPPNNYERWVLFSPSAHNYSAASGRAPLTVMEHENKNEKRAGFPPRKTGALLIR